MLNRLISIIALAFVLLTTSPAWADEYGNTIDIFKNAGESGKFFETAYGYAVFPTIVKGAFVVGGAHGEGRVYAKGKHVGNSAMTQGSVGLQIGGEGYSEIVFFQDERAFKELPRRLLAGREFFRRGEIRTHQGLCLVGRVHGLS